METLDLTSRLDVHEQQIQQLQSDVTEIKASLTALNVDRADSREFRKVVLGWMKQQEKRHIDGSSGSGLNSGVNAFVHGHSTTNSVSDLDQLKALIYQFEEISTDHDYLMMNSLSDSRVSGSNSSSAAPIEQFQSSRAQIADVRSKYHAIGVISGRLERQLGFETVVGQGTEQKIAMGLDSPDLGSLDGRHPPGAPLLSSSSSYMTGKSLPVNQLKAIISVQHVAQFLSSPLSSEFIFPNHDAITKLLTGNPHETGDFKLHSMNFVPVFHRPTNIVPTVPQSQDKIGSELRVVQTFGWKPGWDFGWLDYPRPPAFALKLFVLDEDPKPHDPYTNPNSDLLWKLFHGWCKTASQVAAGVVGSYHLWVVHGQGRPPEKLSGKPPLGCRVSSFSVLRARLF